MKLANRLKLIILAAAAIAMTACGGNDKSALRLVEAEGELQLTFPHEPYAFTIRGGNGEYSAASGNQNILTVAVSGSMLTIRTESAGTTDVTVTDGTGKSLRIPVRANSYRQRMVVEKLYARASGEKLDPSDKATIEARALETIPMASGGGFDFVFTGYSLYNNPAGTVTIYPEKYGTGGTETPFERLKVEEGTRVYTCYSFTAGGRERRYIITQYTGRSEVMQEMSLREDVTSLFADDYPDLENVYTEMSISQPEH